MTRPLKVVGYDVVARTVTVKYGGAYSGTYSISFRSALVGPFKTEGITFTAKFEYTDFNPKSGSKFGGSLITIDGGHFSDDALQNPIKIGYEYQSGVVHYCNVLESRDDQIKCRMSLDFARPAGPKELIVFASTYEEATCSASTCMFEFLDTDLLPTVEIVTPSFDATAGKHIITINGYSITDTDVNDLQVYIGGIEQTVRSVASTEVVVEIDDIAHGLTAETLEIYFSSGAPNGFGELYNAGVTFVPELLGLETAQGSEGGATFNAIISGVGTEDSVILIDASNGNALCESQEMTSYGVLQCTTAAGAISPAVTVALKPSGSSDTFTCSGTGGLTCSYSTVS